MARRSRCLLLPMLPMLMAWGAMAETNAWAPLGPEGGRMRAVAFDPEQPAIAYAVAEQSAFRRVGDAPWQRLGIEGVYSLAVAGRGRVYLGGIGWIARSRDHGAAFGLQGVPGDGAFESLTVDPDDPDRIYGVRRYISGDPSVPSTDDLLASGDGGTSWQMLTSVSGDDVAGLAIDPEAPGTLYLGIARAGVLVSRDRGVTWTPTATSPCPVAEVGDDPVPCVQAILARPGALLIGTGRGILGSHDGGATWQSRSGSIDVFLLTGAPSAPEVLYAAAATTRSDPAAAALRGLVLRSDDGGLNWRAAAGALPAAVGALAVDPRDIDHLAAATGASRFPGHGLYASGDGGASWASDQAGLDGTCVGSVVAAAGGGRTVLFAASYGDTTALYVSRDGGGEWLAPVTDPAAAEFWSLTVDPRDRQRLYAAAYDAGVLVSTDGGAHWSQRDSGIDALPAVDVAVDPHAPDTLYLAGPSGGIAKSTDGGASFTPVLIGTDGRQVEVDAASGAVYALSLGALQVSRDGGATWRTLYDASRGGGPLWGLAVAPTQPATLYVLSGDGLQVSDSGGRRWHAATLPGARSEYTEAVAVDPSNARTAYAAGVTSRGQLYRTDDRGRTWRPVGEPFFGARGLAVDPRDGRIVYAGTCGAGVQLLAQSAAGGGDRDGCAIAPAEWSTSASATIAHVLMIGLLTGLRRTRRAGATPRPRSDGGGAGDAPAGS